MGEEGKKWTPEVIKAESERRAKEMKDQAQKHKKAKDSSLASNPEFVDQCLDANEFGDSLIFAHHFEKIYFYNFSENEFYVWFGHYWKRDTLNTALAQVDRVAQEYMARVEALDGMIREAYQEQNDDSAKALNYRRQEFLKRIKQLRTHRRRGNILEYVKSNITKPLAKEGSELDSHPDLLACKNGVVDLSTGAFRSGRPEQYITKASQVEYKGIEEPAPTWERFLNEIFSENQELIHYMHKVLGYATTGHVKDNSFFVLTGQGRNGKSVLIEIVQHVMGDHMGPIQAELLLDQGRSRSSAGPSPDIMALKGLRLATASETDQGRRISPSAVKWLTGGDTLIGRNPHDKLTTRFQPTHKLFLLTNHKPHAPADDFAFWERLRLIPFEVSFVDREPKAPNERRADLDLKSKLLVEAPGILAWLIKGAILWSQEGLKPPAVVTQATADYHREEDILADFIDECCLVSNEFEESFSKLHTKFLEWYEENISRRAPGKKTFGNMLSKRFERKKSNNIKYIGIKLKDY